MKIAEKTLINEFKANKKIPLIEIFIASNIAQDSSISNESTKQLVENEKKRQLGEINELYSKLEYFTQEFLGDPDKILRAQPVDSLLKNSISKIGLSRDKKIKSVLRTHQYLWSLKNQGKTYPILTKQIQGFTDLLLIYDHLISRQNLNNKFFENNKGELFSNIENKFDLEIENQTIEEAKVPKQEKRYFEGNSFILSDYYIAKGNYLYKQKHFKDALENFQTALIFDDNNPTSYFNIALNYQMLKKRQLALANYNAAISMRESPHYFLAKGELLRQMQKFQGGEGAVNYLGKALQLYEKEINQVEMALNKVKRELRKSNGTIQMEYKNNYEEVKQDLNNQRLELEHKKTKVLSYINTTRKKKCLAMKRTLDK